MPKPRSNADACAYWADGILTREPQPSINVNSIIVRGDTVYSFGSHFPMGIIQRDSRGRCVRVLLNSDTWPGGGFANTGGDQWSCRSEAQARIEQAKWKVELQSVLLSAHGRGGGDVRCKPREGDPEPPFPHLEVPTYFYRTDPGPEPVKDPRGCIAGREESYSYEVGFYDFQLTPERMEQLHPDVYGHTEYIGAANGVITWGEESWRPVASTREYKQCPHCAAFDKLHADWRQKYHGGYRVRDRGFAEYAKWIDTFGTEQEWRDARLRDWRRVAEGRKTYREWRERNYIPFAAVTWVRKYGVSVPNIDAEGYPTRKDQEAYYRAQRAEARAAKARERRHEAWLREQRQLERFKARRRLSFTERAAEVAAELAAIREGITVTISTNYSQEIPA